MLNGRLVKRTWGWYWTILDRQHFKVKLLWFKSGRKCSRQYHEYRNELWLILRGWGSMRVGDKMADVKAGEWRMVPVGEQHKFVAITSSLVLEIQYGDMCVEGDIIRV